MGFNEDLEPASLESAVSLYSTSLLQRHSALIQLAELPWNFFVLQFQSVREPYTVLKVQYQWQAKMRSLSQKLIPEKITNLLAESFNIDIPTWFMHSKNLEAGGNKTDDGATHTQSLNAAVHGQGDIRREYMTISRAYFRLEGTRQKQGAGVSRCILII